MTRRALIVGCATGLALITLSAGAQTAGDHASHHPGGGGAGAPTGGGAAGAPSAAGMAPGAPMGGPAAPPVPPGAPAMAASGAALGAPSAPPSGASGLTGGGNSAMMGRRMAPANPGAAAPAAAGPGAAGGMAGMMAGMMGPAAAGGCMGGNCGPGAPGTPIYPSLMTLPALTPDKRAAIEALASQQINQGMGRLATGSESLGRATQAGDHAAMQQAVVLMREGLDELGAGIAAWRVLSEGKSPRNLALDWFKREMNLASPIAAAAPRTVLGVAPFHLFTMLLLVAFALAMVAMYFVKMRRAAALFGRLEPDAGAPPPGAAPPLGGVPSPSSPVVPPAGNPPPPTADTPAAPPAVGGSPASPAAPPAPSEARAAPPVTANWRGQLRIASIVTETPSVRTFRLLPSSSDRLIPFTFVPGQFLNLAFGIGGARMNRSYSISSSPTPRDYVDLTVRREPRGAVSRHIYDLLNVGDEIETGGPVGRFTFTGTEADSIVLIAGGVGITPMMSIMRYLTERSWAGEIFFLYACRTPTDFIFADAVAALQRLNAKLHVAVTISHADGTDWTGPRGRITKEWLTQTVPDLASRRIHLCGPPSMMDSVKAILTELDVPPERLKTELFGATKPTPAAAGTTATPTAPATGPLVTFSKNNKSAKIHVNQTILELSEELAIGIEFSCRVGTCGVCKVKMTAGEVEMAVEDALDPDDKTNGIILACQAKPKGDVSVEA